MPGDGWRTETQSLGSCREFARMNTNWIFPAIVFGLLGYSRFFAWIRGSVLVCIDLHKSAPELFQQPFHRRIGFIQRGIELARIFAARLVHVRTSATGAAYFFRDLLNYFSCLHARCQISSDAD